MNIPSTLRAGDTIEWTESLSDYPASNNWTVGLDLRAKDKPPITITSSANGNDHDISISVGTSKAYVAGNYVYQAYAYKSANNSITEKYTLQEGQIQILANFTDADSQFDPRSPVKKRLDAIEAVLDGRATEKDMSYSFAGRSISKMSPSELEDWRAIYKAEYQKELDEQSVAAGNANPRHVGGRFNRV